jgi:hypothetical protein
MRKITFYILTLLAFVACNKDADSSDKPSEQVFDNIQFVGEWVSVNGSKTLYTNILLHNSLKLDYFLYKNETGEKSIYQEDHGSWSWYQNRQIMGFSLMNNTVPFHQILELTTGKMLLRNTATNAKDAYYRVVETINLEAGQTAAIQYLQSHSGLSLSSSNESVATVSADGTINGLQGGTAFISLEGGEELCFVKVNVNSRVDRYAAETHLTIDEIVDKYGEPDLTGSLGGIKYGYLYNVSNPDSELTLVQYDFDLLTNEIILIHTAYKSEDIFYADIEYMEEHLFLQESSSGLYFGKKEKLWDNEFIITPFISKGTMYVNYQNRDYNQY